MSTALTTTASGSRRKAAAATWPRRTFIAGVSILTAGVLLAVFAPLFGDPYATPIDGLTPNGLPLGVLHSGHILGTDSLGRDMMARVAYGAPRSLTPLGA